MYCILYEEAQDWKKGKIIVLHNRANQFDL